MLRALGDYRDMSAFEQAPPSENFPRPEIPPGRPGKRVHGFMSMREPLPDDRDRRQDVPPHTTTSVTSDATTSSVYVPAPPQPEFPGMVIVFSFHHHRTI